MTKYTLYRADCKGNKYNTVYPIRCEVSSIDDLKEVVMFDHVSCAFKDDRRCKENFLSSSVVAMDLDNDHTDDPEGWKTIDDIAEAFPDVEFQYIESRHHMKPKTTDRGEIKEPRPKYHIYFPISEIADPEEYELLKKHIGALFPYFDMKCADIPHFFYAVPDAEGGDIE